jgi:hypothetical protein
VATDTHSVHAPKSVTMRPYIRAGHTSIRAYVWISRVLSRARKASRTRNRHTYAHTSRWPSSNTGKYTQSNTWMQSTLSDIHQTLTSYFWRAGGDTFEALACACFSSLNSSDWSSRLYIASYVCITQIPSRCPTL